MVLCLGFPPFFMGISKAASLSYLVDFEFYPLIGCSLLSLILKTLPTYQEYSFLLNPFLNFSLLLSSILLLGSQYSLTLASLIHQTNHSFSELLINASFSYQVILQYLLLGSWLEEQVLPWFLSQVHLLFCLPNFIVFDLFFKPIVW